MYAGDRCDAPSTCESCTAVLGCAWCHHSSACVPDLHGMCDKWGEHVGKAGFTAKCGNDPLPSEWSKDQVPPPPPPRTPPAADPPAAAPPAAAAQGGDSAVEVRWQQTKKTESDHDAAAAALRAAMHPPSVTAASSTEARAKSALKGQLKDSKEETRLNVADDSDDDVTEDADEL